MIAEALLVEDVNLALKGRTKEAVVRELLGKLHGDARVKDWAALTAAVLERDAPAMCEGTCGICVAHGRTSAVRELVMAAGRSETGVVVPEIGTPVRVFFVVGIPAAMDSNYLRMVGAIVRVCRDGKGLEALLEAGDGAEFVAALEAGAGRG